VLLGILGASLLTPTADDGATPPTLFSFDCYLISTGDELAHDRRQNMHISAVVTISPPLFSCDVGRRHHQNTAI